MRSKRGFVLMETIIVISVLCIVLIVLYGAYNKMLIDVNNKSLYDNTEYIYKSTVLREYLEESIDIVNFMGSDYVKGYCSDQLDYYKSCGDPSVDGSELLSFMKVRGVYFILWDDNSNKIGRFGQLEPTTQKYIKTIDEEILNEPYRIMVVMYESENNYYEGEYEYAYLRFGSRG